MSIIKRVSNYFQNFGQDKQKERRITETYRRLAYQSLAMYRKDFRDCRSLKSLPDEYFNIESQLNTVDNEAAGG